MDRDLYEALQQAAHRKRGTLSVLSPKSESVEDRKAFDRLVLALYELRRLGFVKFRDKGQVQKDNMNNDYGYLGIACEFTHNGEKALSYDSYDAYQKSLPTAQPLGCRVRRCVGSGVDCAGFCAEIGSLVGDCTESWFGVFPALCRLTTPPIGGSA